jgi:NAD(P)-dependent dehydrogenase (short-subunit alcohol dehydrogenase family)
MATLEDLFGLRNRVALVTGASAGLGVEFATALASAGADVAVTARRHDQLAEVAARLEDEHGVRAMGVAADLTQPSGRERVFATVAARLGRLDVLVNNAGIAPTGRAESQWPEAWRETLDLNLTALFHCCLLAADAMRAGGHGGRIINVASIFGHLGSSLFRVSAYAASKGGVENLTRQLAVEWAREGITVNAIAPAWFPSEMTAGSLRKEGVESSMGSGCPMNRLGRPGELSTACLFLASPASSYVTGTVIPVDGGYGAW